MLRETVQLLDENRTILGLFLLLGLAAVLLVLSAMRSAMEIGEDVDV